MNKDTRVLANHLAGYVFHPHGPDARQLADATAVMIWNMVCAALEEQRAKEQTT